MKLVSSIPREVDNFPGAPRSDCTDISNRTRVPVGALASVAITPLFFLYFPFSILHWIEEINLFLSRNTSHQIEMEGVDLIRHACTVVIQIRIEW